MKFDNKFNSKNLVKMHFGYRRNREFCWQAGTALASCNGHAAPHILSNIQSLLPTTGRAIPPTCASHRLTMRNDLVKYQNHLNNLGGTTPQKSLKEII